MSSIVKQPLFVEMDTPTSREGCQCQECQDARKFWGEINLYYRPDMLKKIKDRFDSMKKGEMPCPV